MQSTNWLETEIQRYEDMASHCEQRKGILEAEVEAELVDDGEA